MMSKASWKRVGDVMINHGAMFYERLSKKFI